MVTLNETEKELLSHIKYKPFKTLNEIDNKIFDAATVLCKHGLAFYISNGPLRQLRITELGEEVFEEVVNG